VPHEVRSKSNIREVKMEPERVNKISRVRFATISSKLTQVFPSVSQSVSLCLSLAVNITLLVGFHVAYAYWYKDYTYRLDPEIDRVAAIDRFVALITRDLIDQLGF